jgi:hypothetical protein
MQIRFRAASLAGFNNDGVSMRLRFQAVLVVAVSLLLGACASKPQLPVDLGPETFTPTRQERVGVAMTKMPKPMLHLPGADCLLCMIAAQATNSTLARHADSLSGDELATLKEQIAGALRKTGLATTVIPDAIELDKLPDGAANEAVPNLARKNFEPLKQKYGVDKMVIVQIDALGIERNYASYIPTSDPKAVVRGTGYMVNLSKNTYEWYQPLRVARAADGQWDEPAQFPGLTNAYFQAIEAGRDQLMQPFRR